MDVNIKIENFCKRELELLVNVVRSWFEWNKSCKIDYTFYNKI